MATTHKAILGSISSGTLDPVDLYESFLGEFGYLDRARRDEWIKDGDPTDPNDPESYDDEALGFAIDELQDILGEYAPPFCYFGTLEGDAADFGFWFDNDAYENGVADGEILVCDETPEWPYTGEHDTIAQVSDHGNLTLYNRQGEVMIAIV